MEFQQLQFFEESNEEKLRKELQEIKIKTEKMRKSLHAKHGELMKLYLEQKNELEMLKYALCKNSMPDQRASNLPLSSMISILDFKESLAAS